MNLSNFEPRDGATLGLGGALTASPWWIEFVVVATGASQFLMVVAGLVIAGLTIRNLLLRNAIATKQLRDKEKPKE